jgi:hypothetical protein
VGYRPAPMGRRAFLTAYRAGFASLALAALAAQFARSSDRPGFSAVSFFSFFTNDSNIIAASVFLWAAFHRSATHRGARDLVRGAPVVYMVTTGIVFALFLADLNEELGVTLPWVNAVVHQVMPLAVAADWLIDPPETRLAFPRTSWWLAFPAAWLGYTLVRGAVIGWYPYPFLDPANHGAIGVVAAVVGIALFMLGLVWGVARAGEELRHRRDPAR